MDSYVIPEKSGYCLECGDVLDFGGRKDRKFCCEKCRNHYHNRRKENTRRMIGRVNSILLRNHDVLESLLLKGTGSIDRLSVITLGFNPDYVTAMSRAPGGMEYMCYDIRYRMRGDRISGIEKLLTKPR